MTKPTKPRAKVRDTAIRGIHDSTGLKVWAAADISAVFLPGVGYISSRTCRRLAAWLLRAADYLEAKEKGSG